MMLPSDQEQHPSETPRAPSLGGGAAATVTSFTLTASWVSPSIARDRVGAWLRSLEWPEVEIQDIVLAVSEAVSNSIEHGYGVGPDGADAPGPIFIQGRRHLLSAARRRVVVTVRDEGRWKEPLRQDYRGHGLTVMSGCGDDLRLSTSAQGTTVVFSSRAIPGP